MRVVRTTYSKTAKWLHWLVALIVTGLIPVGVTMTNIKEGPLQDRLYVLHESFGVTSLTLMLLRLAVRLRAGPAPAPLLTPLEGSAATRRARAAAAAACPRPVPADRAALASSSVRHALAPAA